MVTGNEMMRMMSYSQTRMLMSAFFSSLEIYSSYASEEAACVEVEFFFEEMVSFAGLAAF